VGKIQRQSVKRAFQVVLLLTVFLAAWYGQVVWNLAKPGVLRVLPLTVAASSTYTPDQSLFVYPALGINAPLTERSDLSPLDVAQWRVLDDDLLHGVSLDYQDASFSEAPHAFIIGHSSDFFPHAYASVFAALGQAKVDDTFQVVVKGNVYRYKVRSTQVLKPWQSSVFEAPIAQAKTNNQHLVSVVTCWPPFTSANRMVVVAERETN